MRGIEMFRGAMDSLSVVEMFNLAGLTLKVKFMEAGNELWKIVSGVMGLFESGSIQSSLQSAALGFKEILLQAAAETAEALAVGAGGKLKTALENAANFAKGSSEVAFAEKERIDEAMKNDKSFVDKFKEARDAAKDIFKVPESDLAAIEDGFQKIRVAADKYTMDRINAAPSPSPQKEDDSSLYDLFKPKPKDPAFEQMGPPKSLANKGIFDAIAKRDSASKAGFGGLAGLYGMQVDRIGGGKVGANSVFNKDRERLGIASGLVTGGLGEKRRLNTKQEKPQEPKEELGFLQSIDRNIKSALTVG
jgi:hypothetical protein